MALDVSHYIGKEGPAFEVTYNRRDLLLYALGIGCTEQQYVYEGADGFAAFPTYPIVLGYKGADTDVLTTPTPAQANLPLWLLPNTVANLDGERRIERVRAIPAGGATLVMQTKIVGIFKRGSGAVLQSESTLRGADGAVYYRMYSSGFNVGASGFVPERCGADVFPRVPAPQRPPDRTVEHRTSPSQALLYRLSGDYNPLHVHPPAAKQQGFQGPHGEGQPILHGLCTLGHACRAALEAFQAPPSAFRAVQVRFVAPTLPGQTLQHRLWREGPRIHVESRVQETGKVVLTNAYVDLHAAPKL